MPSRAKARERPEVKCVKLQKLNIPSLLIYSIPLNGSEKSIKFARSTTISVEWAHHGPSISTYGLWFSKTQQLPRPQQCWARRVSSRSSRRHLSDTSDTLGLRGLHCKGGNDASESRNFGTPFYRINWYDVFGCIWMNLDVFGCFWMYLDVFGCIWMYLDVFGCIWMYLDSGNMWKY